MKKTLVAITLITAFLVQSFACAASSPPKRPVVDTGEQNVSYSTPTAIVFEEESITIALDEYDENHPYKAYYICETDGDGDPRIGIHNLCDNGYQIYGMTDEEDTGRYIAIYPYEVGRDRLIISSLTDPSVCDTLVINIVQSAENDRTSTVVPPRNELDLSGAKPQRPVVDLTEEDIQVPEDKQNEDAFSDVTYEHKGYTAILALKTVGVLSGYPDGSFKPSNPVTRAEACSMVMTLFEDIDTIRTKGIVFDDVPANHWAYSVIAKAKTVGLINGKTVNVFAPEDNITYEEAATILVRLLGQDNGSLQYPYGYINTAYELGLFESTTVRFGENATRHDVAQMIYNALSCDNIGEHDLIALPSATNKSPIVQNPEPEYEQETTTHDGEILELVLSAIEYITQEEATVISNCIAKCLETGVWETSEELNAIARSYPDEALLEEISDIFNSLT